MPKRRPEDFVEEEEDEEEENDDEEEEEEQSSSSSDEDDFETPVRRGRQNSKSKLSSSRQPPKLSHDKSRHRFGPPSKKPVSKAKKPSAPTKPAKRRRVQQRRASIVLSAGPEVLGTSTGIVNDICTPQSRASKREPAHDIHHFFTLDEQESVRFCKICEYVTNSLSY
jgi:hypothetical protein